MSSVHDDGEQTSNQTGKQASEVALDETASDNEWHTMMEILKNEGRPEQTLDSSSSSDDDNDEPDVEEFAKQWPETLADVSDSVHAEQDIEQQIAHIMNEVVTPAPACDEPEPVSPITHQYDMDQEDDCETLDDIDDAVFTDVHSMWPQTPSDLTYVATPAVFDGAVDGWDPYAVTSASDLPEVPQTPADISEYRLKSAKPVKYKPYRTSRNARATPVTLLSVTSAKSKTLQQETTPSVVPTSAINTPKTPGGLLLHSLQDNNELSFSQDRALLETLGRQLGTHNAKKYLDELTTNKQLLLKVAKNSLSNVPHHTEVEVALMASNLNPRGAVALLRRQAMRHTQICAATPVPKSLCRSSSFERQFTHECLRLFEAYEKYRRHLYKDYGADAASVAKALTPSLMHQLYILCVKKSGSVDEKRVYETLMSYHTMMPSSK